MANPNIRFFRNTEAPSNPQEGYIWFNASNNTIQLYKNGAWEIYAGKINDVTYSEGKLTIVPHTGLSTVIDLGSVNSIAGITERLGTLETNYTTLSGEFNTEKGKISTLEGTVGTHSQAIATVIGKLEGIESTVVAAINAEAAVREEEDGKLSEEISNEITRATAKEGELETAISTEKSRVDTLYGVTGEETGDSGKSVRTIAYEVLVEELLAGSESDAETNFETLKELAAWLEEHPEDAAAMNEAIGTNTTGIAANAADIAILKGNVETINTAIEENELAITSTLTDLGNRIVSLEENTVSSVSGSVYIDASTTDGVATVSAKVGSVAAGEEALALASDVKTYVDNIWTWGEF